MGRQVNVGINTAHRILPANQDFFPSRQRDLCTRIRHDEARPRSDRGRSHHGRYFFCRLRDRGNVLESKAAGTAKSIPWLDLGTTSRTGWRTFQLGFDLRLGLWRDGSLSERRTAVGTKGLARKHIGATGRAQRLLFEDSHCSRGRLLCRRSLLCGNRRLRWGCF
jgi:hypothetical protein